ncbi:MAG: VWA domain-containing protein [Verrucomicrobia bacterium]|nr:VWA domain-containing protein [Verrucomicrobiota bacterium]
MKIDTYLDYQTILANHARPVHFAVKFEAASVTNNRPKPAAFNAVIDHSGSMAGEPLKRAKEAAQLAVRNLRPEDHFSLVVFADEAQTLIPLQPAAAKKDEWLRIIAEITDAGSTNLTGGWMLGRDELKKAPTEATRRLLLLSDGHLNVGIVDPPIVKQVVAAGLERDRIRTSCLGFGDGYNEDLMADLAKVTGGQFYDADSAEKLPAIFEAELEGLQKLSVQNLRLRFKRLEFCDAAVLLGNYPMVELPDGRTEIAMGDLVSGETRIVCFTLSVLPLPSIQNKPAFSIEGERLIEMELAFDEIGQAEVASRTITQVIRIQATQNPEDVRVHAEVVPWVAMQTAGKVMQEVMEQMDKGKQTEAIRLLEGAIASLKEYGSVEMICEALVQLEKLLQKLREGEWSERERKGTKYRLESLGKMSSEDLWTSNEEAPSFKRPRRRPPQQPGDTNEPI